MLQEKITCKMANEKFIDRTKDKIASLHCT